MMKHWNLVFLILMVVPASAQTATPVATPLSCAEILAKSFSPGFDPRFEPDCDSTAFYFGIGRPKDLYSAYACAQIEQLRDVNKDNSMFTGAGILSMTYANGEGVTRNLDAARRFICLNKGASTAEINARLKLIDIIATTPVKPPHFDLCATSNSGESEGWCASIQVRLNDAKRYDELVKIFEALTPAQQEAFKKLQTAEGAFEDARALKELDLTGTARGAFELQEQDRLRAQFLSDLKLFARPDFSEPVTLAVVDARIAADLETIQANAPKLFANTTITFAGIQESQQTWLKLRDAWRAYGAAVYPTVSGDAIATQLGRERLYHLRKLRTLQ